MSTISSSPPRAPPIKYTAPNGTRWEKEKAAAGSNAAFELPDDPKHVGPWIIGECIGKGASGRVKIAKHRRTGQLAAVKILPLQPLVNSRASLATQQAKSEKQRLGIDREITMMKLMNHPNIMRIYDVFEGDKELYLVLEYVEGGELFDFLVNRGRLQPLEALAYFKQIVYGLNYAHTFSIIHRDLKPENILIHSLNPPLIKIADWGMAAFAPPALQLETSCGSPHYASPEIVNGEKYEGNATDIWSCGVILYALLTGRLPFDDKNVRTLLAKVKLGKYDLPRFIEPHARDLISRMLVVDVSRRITIPEILAHPWMEYPTPGIQYVPAPPVSELARPLRSAAHIDRDMLESLRIIWGRHADFDNITADLLSPAGGGTLAKAFYFLLLQYRERTLEEHGIVDDVASPEVGRIITKQYTAPLTQGSGSGATQLAVDSARTPRVRSIRPAPPPPQRSSSLNPPGLAPPSPALMRPSSPGRTPRLRPASPAGPRPIRSRPLSSPIEPRPAVYPPVNPNATFFGSTLAQQEGPNRPRALTETSTPSPSLNYGEMIARPHDRRVYFHARSPQDISTVAFPTIDIETVPSTTMRSPGIIHAPTPVLAAPADPLPLLTAPRIANTDFQRTIDDITDRVNFMVAQGNAEMAQLGRHSMHAQITEQTPRSFYPDPDVPGVGENKENSERAGHGDADPMQMAGGLGIAKPQHRGGVMGREMGNIIYVGEPAPAEPRKEKRERKSRPPTLDFHARALNTKRSTLSVLGSPTALSPPAVSSILGSPAVGEVKGWFSNLFNWKSQSYVLHSNDSIVTTRAETARLLELFGVAVVVEDAEGWGMLRCRADDLFDAGSSSGSSLKHARFRVEFTLTPGANDFVSSGATPRVSGHRSRPVSGGMACAIILVQEKGSVSTFRAVCRRLRAEWRLDALMSPFVGIGEMAPLVGTANRLMA